MPSSSEYYFESVKALIETLTKEHAKSLDTSAKAIETSGQTVCEMTDKVEKLLENVTQIMEEFGVPLTKKRRLRTR